MKRNWKLIQEILEFLTLSEEECKVTLIGYYVPEEPTKSVLIQDKYFDELKEIFEGNHLIINQAQDDIDKKIPTLIYNTESNIWDDNLIYYHVSLLTEIKAIKIIIEDVEEIINKADWEYGCYQSANYDELIYDELDDYLPCKGIWKNVEVYQITWLGIEMLDVLTKMEKEEGVNLYELDTPHPAILKYINPLINKANNLKLATLPLK